MDWRGSLLNKATTSSSGGPTIRNSNMIVGCILGMNTRWYRGLRQEGFERFLVERGNNIQFWWTDDKELEYDCRLHFRNEHEMVSRIATIDGFERLLVERGNNI